MVFPIGPDEEKRLQVLVETGALDAERSPALDRICDEVRDHFQVAACAITLLDRTRQLVKAAHGLEPHETPRSMAFCNYTVLSNEVFVVNDAQEDDRFRDNPLVTGAPYIRFYAGAPLTYLRSVRLGALCLLDSKPRPFSRGDKAELQLFADQVVTEIAARDWSPRIGFESSHRSGRPV